MAKSAVYQLVGGGGKSEFNMTPMIDVTFQLIIFFILAGQSASDEIDANVELHRPKRSQALKDEPGVDKAGNRAIVNVVPEDAFRDEIGNFFRGRVRYYSVLMPRDEAGQKKRREVRPENMPGDMVVFLKIRKAMAKESGAPPKEFTMVVRADKRLRWSMIEPLIAAGMEAKIPNMNLSALSFSEGMESE